jgi:hypothetical protein
LCCNLASSGVGSLQIKSGIEKLYCLSCYQMPFIELFYIYFFVLIFVRLKEAEGRKQN